MMRAGSRHATAHPGRGSRPGDRAATKGGPDGAGNATAKSAGMASGAGGGGSHPAARLDTLERLARSVVRAAGMDLEEVQLTPVGRRRVLRVVVDAPGGVGLDDIALVSRALSAELDATGCMGDMPYTLEVTSPGVDRPLTAPRHWQRSVGRMVKVAVTGQGRSGVVTGRVMAADEGGVVLEVDGEQRGFGFGGLGPGRVQVEFRRDDMGESRGH
jgi:ribosome maturation factor RimP